MGLGARRFKPVVDRHRIDHHHYEGSLPREDSAIRRSDLPGFEYPGLSPLKISGKDDCMIALAEIRDLPLHEKLRMMETLWDGIAPLEADLEVPQWHKDLLEERGKLIQDGEATFIDWETAKRQIKAAVS